MCDFTRELYVEYCYMGPFQTRSSKKIDHRDPLKFKVPDHVHEFSFFEILIVTVDDKEGNERVTLKSEPTHHSPRYIPGGKVFTKEDILNGNFPLRDLKREKDKDFLEFRKKSMLEDLEKSGSDKLIVNRWTHEYPSKELDPDGRGIICLPTFAEEPKPVEVVQPEPPTFVQKVRKILS